MFLRTKIIVILSLIMIFSQLSETFGQASSEQYIELSALYSPLTATLRASYQGSSVSEDVPNSGSTIGLTGTVGLPLNVAGFSIPFTLGLLFTDYAGVVDYAFNIPVLGGVRYAVPVGEAGDSELFGMIQGGYNLFLPKDSGPDDNLGGLSYRLTAGAVIIEQIHLGLSYCYLPAFRGTAPNGVDISLYQHGIMFEVGLHLR